MTPVRPPEARPATSLDAGGQGVVEYGLILALSALVAAIVHLFFGGTLSAVLEAIGEMIEGAS